MAWLDFLEILQHTKNCSPAENLLYQVSALLLLHFNFFMFFFYFFQEKLQNPENRRAYNESAGRALAVAFPDVLLQLGLGK